MQGTNRTIARRLLLPLLAIAMVVGALAPATGDAAAGLPQKIKGAWSEAFPEEIHGTSVAIAPDGDAWFGISTGEKGPQLAHAHAGKLVVEPLGKEATGYAATNAVRFDSNGSLWFVSEGKNPAAIVRRDPNGTVTEFPLPKGSPVNDMTFGSEGDIWFVRGGFGEKAEAGVGRMTPTGEVTQFPLEAGARPTSITVGPDGALWFSEEGAGKIGRITTGGEIQLFELAPKAQPRQIVAGAEGALWFGENGQPRKYGKISDRIGRITTDGRVSEFPVPFGTGTSRLAPDPRGVIWFTTDGGEFSSIAPNGNVGARGCVEGCGDPILGLTLAPDGALWFAAGRAACLECGGGADLMLAREGTRVGEIPGGALAPADPSGPPAEDPYANQPVKVPPPIARTGKAWGIEGVSAGITAFINPRGFPTTWVFRWGKTKKYNHRGFLPEFPFEAGEGSGEVEEFLLDLCPGTTYHYEVVAYGPGGHTSGGDRTFTTKREKHKPKYCRKH
jgi:virginiamycin B lyase